MARISRLVLVPCSILVGLGTRAPAAAEPPDPRCPEGTEQVGEPPPAGFHTQCVKSTGDGRRIRHGPLVEWRRDGSVSLLQEWRDGSLHGRSASWYADGQLEWEGGYRFGRAEGVHRGFTKDGELASEARYGKGALEGWVVGWHAHGVKASEVRYRKNRPHGPAREWFPDGGPRSEGEFKDGLRHGEWRYWYRRGALDQVGEWSDGEKHGLWVRRFPNGQTWWKGRYQRGRRQGEFRYWHPDGTAAGKGSFEQGERAGTWELFAPGDPTPLRVIYSGGRPVRGIQTDPNVIAQVVPGLPIRLAPAQAVALARERMPEAGFQPRTPPEPRLVSVSADVPSEADDGGVRSWSVPRSFVGVVWRVEFAGRFGRQTRLGLGTSGLPDSNRAVVEISDKLAAD